MDFITEDLCTAAVKSSQQCNSWKTVPLSLSFWDHLQYDPVRNWIIRLLKFRIKKRKKKIHRGWSNVKILIPLTYTCVTNSAVQEYLCFQNKRKRRYTVCLSFTVTVTGEIATASTTGSPTPLDLFFRRDRYFIVWCKTNGVYLPKWLDKTMCDTWCEKWKLTICCCFTFDLSCKAQSFVTTVLFYFFIKI